MVPERQHASEPDLPRVRARAPERAPLTPTARVVSLQQAVGNRAVGTLLSRAPKGAAKPRKTPEREIPKGSYISVPGIGYIEIESFSWAASHPHGREGEPAPHQVVLSSFVGSHSSKLMQSALEGKPADMELVMQKDGKPYMRYALKNALVTSYSVGGSHGEQDQPVEMWSLNATEIKAEYAQ